MFEVLQHGNNVHITGTEAAQSACDQLKRNRDRMVSQGEYVNIHDALLNAKLAARVAGGKVCRHCNAAANRL